MVYNLRAMITQKTKIVCSIGPSSSNEETVCKMIQSGMNIARFNFSHGTHESHKKMMDLVKKCARNEQKIVGLLLDTKGPEIRTGMTRNGEDIVIKAGDKFDVVADGSECYGATELSSGHISLSWKEVAIKCRPGIKILIADGLIELNVDMINDDVVHCTALNNGKIGSKKNVNLVGLHAGLPILSEQDKKDILFGNEQDVDFIAASFVSFPEEVVEIRDYLKSIDCHAKIIAKIESGEGLENIDGIIEKADGIMIARGDLGVQVEKEIIPLAQKSIIAKCREAGKPVITATQMLDSMIVNPRPTRAELTDVANAVFDGTDAVMLSGETAGGKYPIEAVQTMSRIVRVTEESDEYKTRMKEMERKFNTGNIIGKTIAMNAYLTASEINAKAIVSPTLHGNTTRMISCFRPNQVILAVTPYERTARQLMLSWGINPILTQVATDSETMINNSIKVALDEGAVEMSDSVVMIASIPLHSPLMANTIRVLVVGNVLCRGTIYGSSNPNHTLASGRVVKAESYQQAADYLRHDNNIILVVKRITYDYIPIIRMSNGIIAEDGSVVSADELAQVNKNLCWITNARKALHSLETGQSVTIDGLKGLVYEGLI